MPTDVLIVVLCAALLHATWNAMAKGRQGRDPLVAATVIAAGAGAVSLATVVTLGLPSPASYPYAVASGLIHVGYFLLLGLSYRYADYSAIYPLMRGTAPLLTTAVGFLLIGEQVGLAQLGGILLLSLGVLGLGLQAMLRGGMDRRALTVAAANIAIIVAYTLVDGIGARLSGDPAAYVGLMMLLTGVLLVPAMVLWRPTEVMAMLRESWVVGLLGGTMVMLSYGAALWAMTRAPIGAVAALRETSVLFGAAIAIVFMGEKSSAARAIATVAIFAGLALMRLP
jgi:drug/metabolite transporter (DMT)-like permease